MKELIITKSNKINHSHNEVINVNDVKQMYSEVYLEPYQTFTMEFFCKDS